MSDLLNDLITVLRFQSISTDSQYTSEVAANAEWLHQKLTSLGLTSQIHTTEGHPIVVAKNQHIDGRKTVLLYGHYDVQPVDPLDLWDTPPFEPTIKDGKIFARGATDNKGQHMAHLKAVEQLLDEDGELRVNLTILIEGEEEIGSPSLVPFLEAHKDELACDVVVVSDTGMVAPGTGTMGYGLRGICCCEVRYDGPSKDQHSGCIGGAIANPATEIARLVASLHDDQGRVAVEGFYDGVEPLEQWERDMWADVPGMDPESMLSLTGAPQLHGETGYSSAERLWARPTAEVNGLGGGYQGEGSKTVLPSYAFCKLSFRLVPGQDPEDIYRKVEAHIAKHTQDSVTATITKEHGGLPYRSNPHDEFGKVAQSALKDVFGNDPVLIREGGSIPIIGDFKSILGADTLMLGLALPDAQIHAPNENFSIASFEQGVEMSKALFRQLGDL